ncbi:thioesterase II family protein [Pseudonocardia sp. CA-107938]|uniref:thioesterase II family protein n=1 Tax=Pseudonocardia sp. CA-107938 TaxID=3240021 RepID=UPI003D8DEEE4
MTTDRWLRRYGEPGEPTVRLVCLPHAGGSASYFFPLARALPAHVEVFAVQYPGRQDRFTEPCIDDVGVLAEHLAPVLAARRDLPLVLFGHSMGATVAFEIARRLVDTAGPPAGLVVSARRAPSRHRATGIHLLDDAGLLAELSRLNGTDAAVLDDPELIQLVLPAIRNDYKAAETYRYVPGPPLPVPIVGICGDSDPRLTPDDVAAWRVHTTAGFTLRVLPGGHFYFGADPAALAEIIAGVALQG